MAALSINFNLTDVSCLDGTLLVNGIVFTSNDKLWSDRWKINDQLSFTLTQIEGVYKISNLTRHSSVFAHMTETHSSPLVRGSVAYLRKTEWKASITSLDCAACLDSSSGLSHEQHEAVVFGHGVYVVPSSWANGNELSLITVDPATKKRYLFNHTLADAIVLP